MCAVLLPWAAKVSERMWFVLKVVSDVVRYIDNVCNAQRVQYVFVGCKSLVADIQTRHDGGGCLQIDRFWG